VNIEKTSIMFLSYMTRKISGHFYEPSQGLESVLYKWEALKP